MTLLTIQSLFMSLPAEHHDKLARTSPTAKTAYWVRTFKIESGAQGFDVAPTNDGLLNRAVHHFGHNGPYYTVTLVTFQQQAKDKVRDLIDKLNKSDLLPEGAVLEII